MSAQVFEEVLARLYSDPAFRAGFLRSPTQTLEGHDLTLEERADLAALDKAGLIMASQSFEHKRQGQRTSAVHGSPARRLASLIKRLFGARF
jgi:hypothetical protein